MVCEQCHQEFSEDWRVNKIGIPRFCSRGCSNKRSLSKEAKEAIGKKLRTHPQAFCKTCGKKLVNPQSSFCRTCAALSRKGHSKYGIPYTTHSDYISSRRKAIRDELIEYKGGQCIKCGYHKYSGALQFHHLNPSQKEFTISARTNRSKQELYEEVDKCILICSNCHQELHQHIREGGSVDSFLAS